MDIISDYRAMQRTTVGGKFYTQAQLRSRGVNVPDFFCLSNALFTRMVAPERPRIAKILQAVNQDSDRKAVTSATLQLQALIQAITLDEATTNAIEHAMVSQLSQAEFVSVRACMTASNPQHGEDSLSNPFAGISESFLYVRRMEIWPRIRDCWTSAFSEKALLYRSSQGMDLLDIGVVVGIQRMVFGERSFVLFTCDPNTAARDTLIIAGHGIGEGIVQESVPVDHYFVHGNSDEIKSVLADKDSMMTFDAEAGAGLRKVTVPEARRQSACLTQDEITALVKRGKAIEKIFAWPQDIEGTIDQAGNVHILQTRPIAIDFTKRRIWTGLNVSESYPGISSPLTYTLARLFYRVIFRDVYRRAGATDAQLTDNHHRLDRMIGYVNGRVYYSLNAFYLLHGMVPIFPWLSRAWENMVGLKSSYFVATGEPAATQSKIRRWMDTGIAMARFLREFVALPRRMRHYKNWWCQRALKTREVLDNETDALALTEEFHRLWRDVGREWGVTLVNDAYIFSLYALVNTLFKRWHLDDDPALLGNLLCGDEEIESVEVFLSILRIAEYIRANDALAQDFGRTSETLLIARYRERTLDAQLMAMIDQHINRFGDRSMEDLKMESPSLRLDPSVLFRGIQRFVASDLNAEECRQEELDKRAGAEALIDKHFGRFSLRKRILRRMLKLLREVIAHRENSRYCRSELFGLCRDIFRAQAAHLVERGVIDELSDVYYLTVDEITGYTDGTGVDEDFRDAVAHRRRQTVSYAAQDVADTLATDGALRNNVLTRTRTEYSHSDCDEMQGLGSSMGLARGRARVVLDPNQVTDLPPDTILVARETDPGWLFLMLASTGMVVERGSMLSHTAITGRKFGIPTVVGVEDACTRIANGSLLEIDGGSGIVKRVAP
jgi:pyruvate,water dikinase